MKFKILFIILALTVLLANFLFPSFFSLTSKVNNEISKEVNDETTKRITSGVNQIKVNHAEKKVSLLPRHKTPIKTTSNRTLIKGKYLELIGGYSVPWITFDNIKRKSLSMDLLPNSNRWISGHPANYIVELIEPDQLGTGAPKSWPYLTIKRTAPSLKSTKKISPSGVHWLNENEIITSGRKSYRSGFEPNWLAIVNLNTQEERLYSIFSASRNKQDDFHIMQALGAGFLRLTDKEWSIKYASGLSFLLGRGGYDVLGSPLGPALGLWRIGMPHPKLLLDYPHNKTPARRDSFYAYPAKDPNTYAKAQLPIWKNSEKSEGYWQAGDIGGMAFIHHPQVTGIIATHNHGRGIHDYRAQGDTGSGKYFLVKKPKTFYGKKGTGNRGNHRSESLNQSYPDGVYARVGHIFDPAHIAEVSEGLREPWQVSSTRFEWPKKGLNWSEEAKNHTKLGSITWDNKRQLLWTVIGNRKHVYLAAYKIIVDDNRPEEPITMPKNWTLIK